MSLRATTATLAVIAVATILWLIRNDHLHPRKAISWILVCVAIGALGLFPALADWIAVKLGVRYSPALVLTLGFVVLLIKLLRLDIARTRELQTLLVLSQRVSILEKDLQSIKQAILRNDSARDSENPPRDEQGGR